MHQTMPDVGVIKAALKLACRAPSIHNSQPWRWVYDGQTLQLFLERLRQVEVADSSGREGLMSCGVVLDHLRVALAASGWRTTTERFPDVDEPDHLATVGFGPRNRVSDIEYRRADAILERRTDRLPLQAHEQWDSFMPELQKRIADIEEVTLDVLSDDDRPALAAASNLAEILRYDDPRYQAELQWWTAPFMLSMGIPPEGLPLLCEASRLDVRRDFSVSDQTDRPRRSGADRAALVVLSTGHDTRGEILRCGEALSNVLLECTVAGMATCPLTHIIEVAESRDFIRTLVGDSRHPQVLIRVGVAPTMEDVPAPTPRLPLDVVLDIRGYGSHHPCC